jgi:energy-coupling factor transport system substrate-specific component
LEVFVEPTFSLDTIASDLQELRAANGAPSFQMIAQRISKLRGERVNVSTVFDAFKVGRKRVNAGLIADIALVLTDDQDVSDQYFEQAGFANTRAGSPEATSPEKRIQRKTSGSSQAAGTEAESLNFTHDKVLTSQETNNEVQPQSVALDQPQHRPSRFQVKGFTTPHVILILVLALATNTLLPVTIQALSGRYFPLFLEMVGTALAATLLGPWWGVGVGLTSSYIDSFFVTGQTSRLWFGLIQVAGALLWGYAFRHSKGSFLSFHLVSFVFGLLTGVLGFVILSFHPDMVHSSLIVLAEAAAGYEGDIQRTLLVMRLLASSIDRVLTGFIAVAVGFSISQRYGKRFFPPEVQDPLEEEEPTENTPNIEQ